MAAIQDATLVMQVLQMALTRLMRPLIAQRDEGKQADEKYLPIEERDSSELEQIRAFFPSER